MAIKLDYVKYDFYDLVTQLQNLLKTKNTWTDLYISSIGTTLIEFYGYAANMILYYVERTAEEMYISTAQRKSSIVNLVSLINYKPYRNVSATGNVTFTLAAAKTQSVFIPAKTQLQTLSGTLYSVSQDSVIFPGQLTTIASVVQGEWNDDTYTSIGGIDQEYLINSISVENTNLVVSINGVNWVEVTSFVNSINTSLEYRIKSNLDDTLSVVFGDDINGKSPTVGDVITISYIKSDGNSGNVYSAGSVTTINSTIYDALGTAITDITVTNASTIIGGDDLETTEQIRYNGPKIFATGDRFVTIADGLAIIGDYPSVSSVNVWGENEETPPNYTMYNQIKLSILLQDWVLPNTDFKTTLNAYLYTKAMLGVRFSYVDPTICLAWPLVTIKVKTGYSLSTIQSGVLTALQLQFELGVNSKIGTPVRVLAVNKAIAAIDGVDYGYITLQGYKAMTYHMSSGHDYGVVVDLLPIKPSTVNVYDGTTLIATDNGSGILTNLSGIYAITGTVDYITGAIVLDSTPDLSIANVISIQYQQNLSGDLIVTKSQILKYNDSTITTSYA